MKSSLTILLSLCALGLTAPAPASSASSLELKTVFDRAVGDKCEAPEGSGDCRNTSKCKGISYPARLCPKDPTDVQCCVEIKCKAPYGENYCRSVSNNGCSGGKFEDGYCPGSKDIQCCVTDSSPPPPSDPKPPAPDLSAWPNCQKTLSCSFAQIASSSMAARLDYVRYMQSNFFGRLNAGNQYRAIEGVITFFNRNSLGPPESWISYVDAGIVEGIQRGGAIALGMSSDTGGNSGSELWATFLRGMRDGKLDDRGDHDKAWSEGEQASTEYGAQKADAKFQRSARERNWYWTTQLFRLMMRHRTISLIFLPDNFVDWLTDVTNSKPGDCMSETAWFFAGQLDGAPSLSDLREANGIIKKLILCFSANG